jgi:hypothetical protein
MVASQHVSQGTHAGCRVGTALPEGMLSMGCAAGVPAPDLPQAPSLYPLYGDVQRCCQDEEQ